MGRASGDGRAKYGVMHKGSKKSKGASGKGREDSQETAARKPTRVDDVLQGPEAVATQDEVDAMLAAFMEQAEPVTPAAGGGAKERPKPAADAKAIAKLKKRIENPVKRATGTGIPDTKPALKKPQASAKRDDKARSEALKRLAFHCRLMERGGLSEVEREEQWLVIEGAIETFERAGGSQNDAAFTDLIAKLKAFKIDDFEPGERLREILGLPRETKMAADTRRQTIERAAALLSGSVVVLIGGVPCPNIKAALKAGLNLKDLNWVDSRPHQSTAPFEPHVAKERTRVVLLAIRWSSHSFADVSTMCERHGKLFVRLPAGLGVAQVAHQVMEQVGKRLAG